MSARTVITPETFYVAWLRTVSQMDDDTCRSKRRDRKEFTACMKLLIEHTGRSLGFLTLTEHHSIDVVFFEEKDTEHFAHGTYPKYLAVAIEHENDLRMTAQEMNKLQWIDAPLRVLIAYALDPWEKAHGYLDSYLKTYTGIVRYADWMGVAEGLRRQLVIFGNAHERPFGWLGYVYGGAGFQRLNAEVAQ